MTTISQTLPVSNVGETHPSGQVAVPMLIDADLMRELELLAAEEGTTVDALMNEAARLKLASK